MAEIEQDWLSSRIGQMVTIRLTSGQEVHGTLTRHDAVCLEMDRQGGRATLIYRTAIALIQESGGGEGRFRTG